MGNSEGNERVPFDEDDENGLILEGKYIPEELLSELFISFVDYRTLCQCQLVCKRWNNLIQSYVWRKKAEMTLGRVLPPVSDTPWPVYYFICKKVLNRNLIRNHSGKERLSKWTITDNGGNRWEVEEPPLGVPSLPDDAVFEGAQHCFVTSYGFCRKKQTINLLEEGFSEYLLDVIQPPIRVSEWYSCRWDCPASYSCTVELIQGKNDSPNNILDICTFSTDIENEDQNKWFKFEHEFKNYGRGLRKIKFCHAGKDKSFWAGHYGSKMAGACVYFDLPDSLRQYVEAETEPLDPSLDQELDDQSVAKLK